MERYNYEEAVKNDVRNYIEEEGIDVKKFDREELEEKLNEDLWIEDSVTGNGSGSYTFDNYTAEENICHNLDLLGEALEEFGDCSDVLKKGAEACDVTIRCYLLGSAISEVLDELYEEDDEQYEEE